MGLWLWGEGGGGVRGGGVGWGVGVGVGWVGGGGVGGVRGWGGGCGWCGVVGWGWVDGVVGVSSETNGSLSTKVRSSSQYTTMKSPLLYEKSSVGTVHTERHRVDTVVEAVVNQTAVLPCRPLKKARKATAPQDDVKKGTLLWKRVSTNDYLIHDNRRLHQDSRFILDMSSVDQTVMDLRIDNVQRHDQGTYVCLYSNGQNVYKQTIELTVFVPPIIYDNTSSPTRVVVQEGDSAVLYCKAWGIPEPTLTWHLLPRDGSSMPLNRATDSRFILEPNHLRITNVTRMMNGLYKCLATNGLEKTASRTIELDVQFPPTIRMANNKIGQLIHRNTMVRAFIRGNPITSFYWEFERRPIYGPSSNCLSTIPREKYCVVIDKINSVQNEVQTTVFINNLTRQDYGLYTCVVETPFGMFRNSTEVFRTYPTHSYPWGNRLETYFTSGSRMKDGHTNGIKMQGQATPSARKLCHSHFCGSNEASGTVRSPGKFLRSWYFGTILLIISITILMK
ncbi:unnamed protein product [Dicrocoelium dendriticum]|nr:unnamed protein product [Dicrocoelium dendriticum]